MSRRAQRNARNTDQNLQKPSGSFLNGRQHIKCYEAISVAHLWHSLLQLATGGSLTKFTSHAYEQPDDKELQGEGIKSSTFFETRSLA